MGRIKNYKKTSCFKKLSSREMQVTFAIIDEMCTSEISKNFGIKSNTVSTVKKNIFIKLNIKSDIGLYKLALKEKILHLNNETLYN